MAKQDIKAGGAFVELSVRKKKFLKGLGEAGKKLKDIGQTFRAFGIKVSAAGAAVTAPFVFATKTFADAGSAIGKLSTQTGNSVRELSRMAFAIEQVDGEFDDLAGATEEFNIRLGETLQDGVGPMAEAFKKLDVNARQLAKMPLTKQLGLLGDKLNQLSSADRQFLADEIFGGDAFRILPLLRKGSEGIEELAKQSDAFGATLDGKTVAAAEALTKTIKEVKASVKGAAIQIGAAIAGPISKFAKGIQPIAETVTEWIKQNKNLVVGIMGIGAGLTVAGTALVAFGFAVSGIGTALSALASVIGFITSPLGLLVAGVVAGTVAFFKFTDAGKSLAARLRTSFGEIAKVAKQTFGGIADALKSGDIKLAGEIAMTGLKLVVMQAMESIANLIGGTFGDTLKTVGGKLLKGDFVGAFQSAAQAIAAIWAALMEGMTASLNQVLRALTSKWESTTANLAGRLASMDLITSAQATKLEAQRAVQAKKNLELLLKQAEVSKRLEAGIISRKEAEESGVFGDLDTADFINAAREQQKILDEIQAKFKNGAFDFADQTRKQLADAAKGEVGTKADTIRSNVDSIFDVEAARKATDEAFSQLSEDTEEGANRFADSVKRLQARLAELGAQAKRQADKIGIDVGGGGGKNGGGGIATPGSGPSSFVTTSARAIDFIGGDNKKPEERAAKAGEKAVGLLAKIHERMVAGRNDQDNAAIEKTLLNQGTPRRVARTMSQAAATIAIPKIAIPRAALDRVAPANKVANHDGADLAGKLEGVKSLLKENLEQNRAMVPVVIE